MEYIGTTSAILNIIGSMSMGPGSFLLVNAIALTKTFTVWNPDLSDLIKKPLNNQLSKL